MDKIFTDIYNIIYARMYVTVHSDVCQHHKNLFSLIAYDLLDLVSQQ